jgi:hypothetical protein
VQESCLEVAEKQVFGGIFCFSLMNADLCHKHDVFRLVFIKNYCCGDYTEIKMN